MISKYNAVRGLRAVGLSMDGDIESRSAITVLDELRKTMDDSSLHDFAVGQVVLTNDLHIHAVRGLFACEENGMHSRGNDFCSTYL